MVKAFDKKTLQNEYALMINVDKQVEYWRNGAIEDLQVGKDDREEPLQEWLTEQLEHQ